MVLLRNLPGIPIPMGAQHQCQGRQGARKGSQGWTGQNCWRSPGTTESSDKHDHRHSQLLQPCPAHIAVLGCFLQPWGAHPHCSTTDTPHICNKPAHFSHRKVKSAWVKCIVKKIPKGPKGQMNGHAVPQFCCEFSLTWPPCYPLNMKLTAKISVYLSMAPLFHKASLFSFPYWKNSPT